MLSNIIVTITTMSQPDYEGKATQSKYECFVNFGSWRDNQDFVKSWLRSFCNVRDEHMTPDVLEDHNYARAIAARYFAEKWERVTDNKCTNFVSQDKTPGGEPTVATDKYKMWVNEVFKKEVETPESVARAIMKHCRFRAKVSAADARAIFSQKQDGFLWEDVLREFGKLGGAYTDKYFRMDR